jgi:hypothetical protein
MAATEILTGLTCNQYLIHAIYLYYILQVVHGTMNVPTSAVTLKGPDGMTSVAQGTGTGACDHSEATFDV